MRYKEQIEILEENIRRVDRLEKEFQELTKIVEKLQAERAGSVNGSAETEAEKTAEADKTADADKTAKADKPKTTRTRRAAGK